MKQPFKVLAISGSLRNASSNTAILKAAQQLALAKLEVVLFEGLADLPHFNPDLEFDPPVAVLGPAPRSARCYWLYPFRRG